MYNAFVKFLSVCLLGSFFYLCADEQPSTYLLNRKLSWNRAEVPRINRGAGEIRIAYWNILVLKAVNKTVYPQYMWQKRSKPIVKLILKDRPDVLGFCECKLLQARDLIKRFEKENYTFIGYSTQTLQSIDEMDTASLQEKEMHYGEFVGVLFDRKRLQLIESAVYKLEPGVKHNRILVLADFYDRYTKRRFVVLSSHFDHLSEHSRMRSAELELELIHDLEKRDIPWFSVGDRNWYPNQAGQRSAEKYIHKPYICDFRDETEQGHFGPTGTFVGHLGEKTNCNRPVVKLKNGMKAIRASTVDVGFRSRRLVRALNSYAYTGEFHPVTYKLLPTNCSGDVAKRNFASDHYYIGGTFLFRSHSQI